MSSSHVGCQAEVRAKAELAFYQHYFSYCLNLAISHFCQIAGKKMIESINETFFFFKRQKKFQHVLAIKYPKQKEQKLRGL